MTSRMHSLASCQDDPACWVSLTETLTVAGLSGEKMVYNYFVFEDRIGLECITWTILSRVYLTFIPGVTFLTFEFVWIMFVVG